MGKNEFGDVGAMALARAVAAVEARRRNRNPRPPPQKFNKLVFLI